MRMKRTRAIELFNVFGAISAGKQVTPGAPPTPPSLDPQGFMFLLTVLEKLKPVFEAWDKVRAKVQRDLSKGNEQMINGQMFIGDPVKIREFESVMGELGEQTIKVSMPLQKAKLEWFKVAENGISALSIERISEFLDLGTAIECDKDEQDYEIDDVPVPKKVDPPTLQ